VKTKQYVKLVVRNYRWQIHKLADANLCTGVMFQTADVKVKLKVRVVKATDLT